MDKNSSKKITKIVIDKDACIGAATCVALASKAFILNDDNVVELMDTAMEHTDEELIIAAKSCPTQAIKLLDASGNEVN